MITMRPQNWRVTTAFSPYVVLKRSSILIWGFPFSENPMTSPIWTPAERPNRDRDILAPDCAFDALDELLPDTG